jgi:hypothetical protein
VYGETDVLESVVVDSTRGTRTVPYQVLVESLGKPDKFSAVNRAGAKYREPA